MVRARHERTNPRRDSHAGAVPLGRWTAINSREPADRAPSGRGGHPHRALLRVMSAFVNTGYAVAKSRGSYVPKADVVVAFGCGRNATKAAKS